MNDRYSMSMALLTLFVCLPMQAEVSFSTTGDEVSSMLGSRYNALSEKWAPLLHDVSEHSVEQFLDSLSKELIWKMSSSYSRHVDQECGNLIDEMIAWPYKFVREELVRDIRSLAALEHEARTLGLSDSINDTFLRKMQDIRIQVAELPEYKVEREGMAKTRKMHHTCIVSLAIATIGYTYLHLDEMPHRYPLMALAGIAGIISLTDLMNNW